MSILKSLFHYLHKVVAHYFRRHEHKHDGKAVGDVSRCFHHDDGQAEGHPHDAPCGECGQMLPGF